jgi:hypothetical protein
MINLPTFNIKSKGKKEKEGKERERRKSKQSVGKKRIYLLLINDLHYDCIMIA